MSKYNIKKFQQDVDEILDSFPFSWSNYAHYVHLVEEIGELGEAMTVYEGDRKAGTGEKALADHSDIKEEIGDTLFALVRVANKLGIDIDEAIDLTFKRYKEKLQKYSKITPTVN